MNFFPRFMLWIRRIEGGLVDDPRDTGGITYVGLTVPALVGIDRDGDGRADYDLDGDGDVDSVDIRLLQEHPEKVEEYYRTEVWDRCRADSLSWPVGLAVCDLAVHSGRGAAALALQRSLNAASGHRVVDEDGAWGPRTAQAAIVASGRDQDGRLFDALELERRLLLARVIRARTRKEFGRLLGDYEQALTKGRPRLGNNCGVAAHFLQEAEAYGVAFERGWFRRLALLAREARA